MKCPSRRNSLPKEVVSCTSTCWNGERKRSNSRVERTKIPLSSVEVLGENAGQKIAAAFFRHRGPRGGSPGTSRAAGAALFHRAEQLLRLGGIVGRVVADVHVDGHEAVLRPGVNRQMRFGEQHRPGDAQRRRTGENFRRRRSSRNRVARRMQSVRNASACVISGHVGRAAVPFSEQMNAVHNRILPAPIPKAGNQFSIVTG